MHNYTKYFIEKKGFSRFINKLYEKYQTLSKFSGTIKLTNLTEEEARDLSRFFGTNYQQGTTITIQIKKFLNIMNNSKYEDFDIQTLVEEYLEIKLTTKKEELLKENNEELKFYQDIINNIDIDINNYELKNNNNNSIGTKWLKDIITNNLPPYKLIHQRYNKNKLSLKKELINIIKLIDNIPKNEKILLPIYSSIITKDPHYLDLDNNHINLYFYALSYINKVNYPNTREEKIKLLSKNNIEIDNLTNYVLTYNLLSDKEYINLFSKNKQSLILNIQNILNTNYFDTKSKKVFIFENPSILTEIISRNIDTSIIISSGFPNLSVYLLIDRLISRGNTIYYNGDFDPEGLLIANKLKEKYSNNLILFCYDEIDYNNCISNKKINDKRLNKLSKVNALELTKIKKLLLNNKYSAYQENNKERIIDYINKEDNNK